jgi:hypothetical protein
MSTFFCAELLSNICTCWNGDHKVTQHGLNKLKLKWTHYSAKKTNGQREILLKKLLREEETSNKRWQSKNAVWLKKYAESIQKEYDNKNPFVKTSTQYTKNSFTPETNIRFSEKNI